MKEYSGDDLAKLGMPSMREVEELVEQLKQVLRGQPPMVQGAVLADMVAKYFAGYHPSIREQAFTVWNEAMRSMIKVNEVEILQAYGLTADWERKH